MLRPVVLLSLLFALPVSADTEIFSWKDKDGKVHYSDVPPASGEVKTLRGGQPTPPARTPAPATGAAADAKPADVAGKPQTLAERELAFRERRAAEAEAQAKAEKEAADAAERQRVCEQARNQLAALTSGQRVSRFNSAGERVVLDDAARAEEIERTRKQVEDACN